MIANTENLRNRQLLHDRHRLSHEQIDLLLEESFAGKYLQEKLSRMAFIKNYLEITDILRNAGISFICIKGPLLSYRIYGDASIRYSHDIDLLIEEDSIENIIKVMCDAHYEMTDVPFWPKEKHKQDIIRQNTHHLSFLNKELRFMVEFHWVLTVNLPVSPQEVNKLLSQNMDTISYAGRNFTVLSPEFELVYLLIHGSRHQWSRLKWLIDIKDYPVKNMDLIKFYYLINCFHAERILTQTNKLLFHYFGQQLPVEGSKRIPDILFRYAITSIENPDINNYSNQSIIQDYLYQNHLFKQLYYRWGIFKSAFSRPGDIALHDFPSRLLYYLYRPIGVFKRRIIH
jgi:uncharacterized membrane protein